jgi:hypothetical protein
VKQQTASNVLLFKSEPPLMGLPNSPVLNLDETLYSWAGAVHQMNPTPSALETSLRLYGAPYAALMHDFPSHLGELDRRFGGALGKPAALAARHTLLGYFLTAREDSVCAQIVSAVEVGALSSLKFRLGIAASRVGGHHPLKVCQRCFDAQEARGGRAYWRVVHQLPSVLCCEEHDAMLDIAWDPITPVHRRGWILPRSGLRREWRRQPAQSSTTFDQLCRLASFSAKWAEMGAAAFDPVRLASTYRRALRDRELVTGRQSLRLAEIVQLIKVRHQGLEVLDEFRALRNSNESWAVLIGSIARKAPRACHPLKHLLMLTTLFSTWGEFLATYDSSADVVDASPKDDVQRSQRHELEQRFKDLVIGEGLSVSAAGRRVGVSATSAVRWAKVLGVSFTSRAKIYTPERLAEARMRLQRGDEKAHVARELAISEVTINRLLSSEPDVATAWRRARHAAARQRYRERFLSALALSRSGTLKEVRAEPGNGYPWLYRHDRAWLLEHLPFMTC